MTTDERADAQLDDALEAMARPAPPGDHVARVLARTGPAHGGGLQAAGDLRARWVLPLAASLLVAAGVTWSLGDVTLPPVSRVSADDAIARDGRLTDGSESRPYQPWGAPREIDRPVLPPEAYWAMDAFEEWRTLRPGTGGTPLRTRATDAPEMTWAPVPSGLPPIELETIVPVPLAFEPLADPAPIDLPAITLEPIVIAPLEHEERP